MESAAVLEQVSRNVTVRCEGGLGNEVYGRVGTAVLAGEVVVVKPQSGDEPLTDWETLVVPCSD